jgi:hypothetical protein
MRPWQETAALRDFDSAYVGLGSNSTGLPEKTRPNHVRSIRNSDRNFMRRMRQLLILIRAGLNPDGCRSQNRAYYRTKN